LYLKDGTSGDGVVGDPIVASGAFNTNLASTKIDSGLAAASSVIDATNLFGATTALKAGFIKNYLYPAFLFKCTHATDGSNVGFAAEAKIGSAYYYQSFKCTSKAGGRTTADATLLNHASLAELNADASNRLVASTIKDLSLAADGTLNKVTTVNPTTNVGGNWLEAGIIDNFGKKLAGEFFTVGAKTNGITDGSNNIKTAIMTLIATAECTSNQSTLNFLTPHAKV